MKQQKETELILALDCEDKQFARNLLKEVQGELPWVKIGLQMFTAHGMNWVEEVHSMGFKLFLDLKLHDIPNTVGKAVLSLADAPINMLTLHASGGSEMCEYAVRSRDASNPNLTLLAVTVLTSMNHKQLSALNVNRSVEDQVLDLAQISLASKVDGLVASPLELPRLRTEFGSSPTLVCPGIRPKGADLNEQKRVMTPEEASQLGANFIVVGRPILSSPDPKSTVTSIRRSLSMTQDH